MKSSAVRSHTPAPRKPAIKLVNARKPGPQFLIDNVGEVLATFPRGNGALVVRRVDFGKGMVIDVRMFYADAATGKLAPMKQGFYFTDSKDLLALSSTLYKISEGQL